MSVSIGEGVDNPNPVVDTRSVVLSKRTLCGPVAYVKKFAFLERSREYGNKAHIGVEITIPCKPHEVYATLEVIDDMLDSEMETALKVVKDACGNLIDQVTDAPSKIRTKRGERRKKKEAKPEKKDGS